MLGAGEGPYGDMEGHRVVERLGASRNTLIALAQWGPLSHPLLPLVLPSN
jgi:hypothetical protein